MNEQLSAKFLELAKKIGLNPELISNIEWEIKKWNPPEVIAVSVSKKIPDIKAITDEEIDKMSEKEAKDMIKSFRDAKKWDDMEEDMSEDKKETLQDKFTKIC